MNENGEGIMKITTRKSVSIIGGIFIIILLVGIVTNSLLIKHVVTECIANHNIPMVDKDLFAINWTFTCEKP
jgi:hypothetical protein